MTADDSFAAGGARSRQRRCKKCHGARRSLRAWFVKLNRQREWDDMDLVTKKQMIIDHKDNSAGKGQKRTVHVGEKASCTDKIAA